MKELLITLTTLSILATIYNLGKNGVSVLKILVDMKSKDRKLLFGKTTREIIKNICGKKLGHGIHRDVYQHKHFPNRAISILKQ